MRAKALLRHLRLPFVCGAAIVRPNAEEPYGPMGESLGPRCGGDMMQQNFDLLLHPLEKEQPGTTDQLPAGEMQVEDGYWADKKTGVKFPRQLEVPSWQKGQGGRQLPLLGAGVRCMLGNSVLCDQQPMTRVYAFGCYVDQQDTKIDVDDPIDFDTAMLTGNKFKGTRAIRIVSMVPKDGHHWAHGYFKVILTRLKQLPGILRDKKRMDAAVDALMEFCTIFATQPPVVPGTEVLITWVPGNGIIVQIDGIEHERIESKDLAEAIWNTYFGRQSVQPEVTSVCRGQWAKQQMEQKNVPLKQDELNWDANWSAETAPKADPCIMRGFQWAEYTYGKYPKTGKLGHQMPFGEGNQFGGTKKQKDYIN